MKKTIINLKMLQDLDDQINYWQLMISDAPEIIKTLREKLNSSEAEITKLMANLTELENYKKDLEAEVVSLNDKKEKQKNRQLQVKTNEEFQKLLKEIEYLTEEIADNETLVLENLEKIEKIKIKKPELEEKYQQELIEFKNKEEEIKNAILVGDEKLQEHKKQRPEICENIPLEFLSRYTNLSGNGKRKAMVHVIEGMCTSCMMTVTPQLFNELQVNERILFCSNCNKFVYDPNHIDFNPDADKNSSADESVEKE